MRASLVIFAGLACLSARAEFRGDAAFLRAFGIIARQESAVDSLLEPAEATAEAMLGGRAYYLAGDPIWVEEGCHRAGGTLAAERLPDPAVIKPGDVVWLAYSDTTYRANTELGSRLERRGAVVVYFGPVAPLRASADHWIDSKTGAGASATTTLLGNILSLWSETGELAGCLARRHRTLVFLQSHVIQGSLYREKFYPGPIWHDGWPEMQPVAAGQLARDYLQSVDANLRRVRRGAGSELGKLAGVIARRAAAHHPAILMATGGHVMPSVLSSHGGPYLYRDADKDAAVFAASLVHGDLVVFFGYVSVPRDMLGAVHRAGAKAVWIISPLPQDGDLAETGDVLLDQGWTDGDAAVRVPGYDIRILPPSGAVELVIFESLME